MEQRGELAAKTAEKALGQKLQDARKLAGLTQQDLCNKAGLSYSTLAKIERGAIKAPSIFTIQSIAEALGTSLDALLGSGTLPASLAQQSKNGIKFVYFDIHGCMVRFFHRAFAELAHETGEPADAIEMMYWHYNDQICRGELPLENFNAMLAERLHIPTVDWESYYLDAIDPIVEMHALAKEVAQRYKIGLLSNIMPGFIMAMRARDLLPDINYDAIIDSSEVKAIKPEPKIYEAAAELAGVRPAEILLIDDSRTNVMAAEKLGWHVVWFDDYRVDESVQRIRSVLD